MEMMLIESAAELEYFCTNELATAKEVAVDTESDQYHAYRSITCLIQLATRDACALVDPLGLTNEDLQPLWDIFADPKIEKILHSAANDLNVIERDYGARFNNVFDTQVGARFLRYERDSLAFLLDRFFGLKASKQFQKFDWKSRPLPAGPRRYAAEDVIYLHEIRDSMQTRLEEDGWWGPFLETCTSLAQNTHYSANPFNEDGWRKLKYPKGFTGSQRAVLKAVYRWRHEVCLDVNMAMFRVLPNHAVVKIGSRMPQDEYELKRAIGRMQNPVAERLDDLIEVIEAGRHDEAPPKRPARKPSQWPRQTPEEEARYEALRAWRNTIAEEEDLPFELISNNATLRTIAREEPSDIAGLVETCGLLNWQAQDFGNDILEILRRK